MSNKNLTYIGLQRSQSLTKQAFKQSKIIFDTFINSTDKNIIESMVCGYKIFQNCVLYILCSLNIILIPTLKESLLSYPSTTKTWRFALFLKVIHYNKFNSIQGQKNMDNLKYVIFNCGCYSGIGRIESSRGGALC